MFILHCSLFSVYCSASLLFRVYCSVFTVQSSLFSVYCSASLLFRVYRLVFHVQSSTFILQRSVFGVQCSVCSVFSVFSVHCSAFTVQRSLFSIHCSVLIRVQHMRVKNIDEDRHSLYVTLVSRGSGVHTVHILQSLISITKKLEDLRDR